MSTSACAVARAGPAPIGAVEQLFDCFTGRPYLRAAHITAEVTRVRAGMCRCEDVNVPIAVREGFVHAAAPERIHGLQHRYCETKLTNRRTCYGIILHV